ncbi:hypothetical protein TNCV_2635941 [Trichonephila clavipes]|nr:hypothetical protein TNCV_2635941 [Trichonephila clavipes]
MDGEDGPLHPYCNPHLGDGKKGGTMFFLNFPKKSDETNCPMESSETPIESSETNIPMESSETNIPMESY